MAYTYIVRCKDGSLYTGIAMDIRKRLRDHYYKTPQCARYTKSHSIASLEALWQGENYSAAAKLEWAVKHLTKKQKEALIAEPNLLGSLCSLEEEYTNIPGVTLEDYVEEPDSEDILKSNK